MMTKIFVLLHMMLWIGITLQAQQDSIVFKQDFKLIIGFETGGTVAVSLDSITREKSRSMALRFVPHLSVYYKSQIGIGLLYEYEFAKTPEEKFPSLYGYGVYLRYYPKLRYKSKFFRERFLIAVDVAYNISNYYSINEGIGVVITDKLENKRIQFIIGANWRIFKGLYFVHGLRFEKDLRSKGWSGLNVPVGFQYHF